jgi:hypothetical protein
MTKKVPFQRFRILWFGLCMVYHAARSQKTNPQLSLAYTSLAELAELALHATTLGKQEQFLRNLDHLEQMFDGNYDNIPDWLKKDRK